MEDYCAIATLGPQSWTVRIYSRPSPTVAPFDDALIPRPDKPPDADRTAGQLQKLQEQLAAKDEALVRALQSLKEYDETIADIQEGLEDEAAGRVRSLQEF